MPRSVSVRPSRNFLTAQGVILSGGRKPSNIEPLLEVYSV